MPISQIVEVKNQRVPVEKLCGWGVWKSDLVFDYEATKDLQREQFNIFGVDPKTLSINPNIRTKNNPFRRLNIVGAAPIRGGERMMLWEVGRKVLGKDTPNYPQEIGDCVSHGARNAIEHVQFFPLANGLAVEFKEVFPPYLYGTGRVFIGKGQLGANSDGSLGSWQAEAVMKYGTIPIDTPGCPSYSGGLAKKWGARPGPPKEFVDYGAKYLVKSAALVKTWSDVVQAIMNGYPVTVASNVGYDMKARADGFHHHSTQWGHQLCTTPYTVISYVNPKEIRNIKVGDKVFSHDGKSHLVTEVFQREYKGKLIVIKPSGNLPLEVTPNHPVMVIRNDKKEWINAENVVKEDILVCSIPNLSFDKQIIPDWVQTVNNNKLKPLFVNDELSWLFGLYIADGGVTKNHKIEIKLGLHEEEYANRAANAIKLLGLEPKIKYRKNHICVKAYSSTLAKSFLEWFGSKTDKHIPEWLFTWNIREVVNGIYAGDGNIPSRSKTGKNIVNTSRILIDQIRSILLYLNERPFIGRHIYKGKHSHWNTRYYISWNPNGKHRSFNHIINNEYLMKIVSIEEKEYEGNVYNFEVEDLHSYIAEGVVVHNCVIGIDNDYSSPYCAIRNSWGLDCHGIVKDFTTGEDWPGGMLRVLRKDLEKALSEGDSFAYSQFDGFPAQDLSRSNFDIFK